MLQTTITHPDPKKIAAEIDANNNGYSSFAEAFIVIIRRYRLPDPDVINVFDRVRYFKKVSIGTQGLLH